MTSLALDQIRTMRGSEYAECPSPQEALHSPQDCDAVRQDFLNAMSRRVSSVNLVVTDGPGGRFGLTVTCMNSITADPPMVMIGINRKSPLCDAVGENGSFTVNLLSTEQKHLADSFAGMGPDHARYDFSQAKWHREHNNTLILSDSAAAVACELVSFHDVGSHRLFMGRVVSAKQGGSPALCYSERGYKCAQPMG
ncbi:flavin reductase family protein [Pontibacterium granulatum]|uniref:flavin reductase family protein n=1 Tax=Pontibacterium granulatum TaxID=2036029 RepID=UPI00249B1B58|nr:flavin reductase family protein [Pontibacterium granulatum]MDI3324510.1 flavin reductase family protein [Pontibacterium granulatum]